VLFAAFAFVVLLGTVFPLVIEAVNDDRISVGAPYFNRMTTPIAISLLFLMAVAPALPWRKASGELLRTRLQWPAWGGAAALVLAVVIGARGLAPLLAFGLGGFAAAAAVRQLFLATRARGLRGLTGRANGGMIVHLGVIIVAVAFTAASSYATTAKVRLEEGETATVAGHTVRYLGVVESVDGDRQIVKARIEVDGDGVHEPALTQFPNATQTIGTPSVAWGFREDVYLTLASSPESDGGPAVIGVIVEPLVSWLWIGGGVMAVGTVLSVWPGRRQRRPTDPSSTPDAALVAA
jgi:cytochrome c-type biogenesis protein CcmF